MGRCRCCWCWGASSSPHRRAATGPDGRRDPSSTRRRCRRARGRLPASRSSLAVSFTSVVPSVCAKTRPNAWQCVETGLHCRLRFQAVSERVTGVEPATLCLASRSDHGTHCSTNPHYPCAARVCAQDVGTARGTNPLYSEAEPSQNLPTHQPDPPGARAVEAGAPRVLPEDGHQGAHPDLRLEAGASPRRSRPPG